jgi:DNA repair exonuclease SbcCD ATPase subunit
LFLNQKSFTVAILAQKAFSFSSHSSAACLCEMEVPPTLAPSVVLSLQRQIAELQRELDQHVRFHQADHLVIEDLEQKKIQLQHKNERLQHQNERLQLQLEQMQQHNEQLQLQLQQQPPQPPLPPQTQQDLSYFRRLQMEDPRMEQMRMEQMRMERTRVERTCVEEQARLEKQVKEDSIMVAKLTIAQLHDARNREERVLLLNTARTKIEEIMQFYPDDHDVSNLCKSLDDFVQKNYDAIMPESSSACSNVLRACNREVDCCYPCSTPRCPNKLPWGMRRGLCLRCEASRN